MERKSLNKKQGKGKIEAKQLRKALFIKEGNRRKKYFTHSENYDNRKICSATLISLKQTNRGKSYFEESKKQQYIDIMRLKIKYR